ncbi:hypothetical protein CsSME_00016905 [Camellia sinensis var. sinensis]
MTRFPCQEARLLEGCENLDTLTSPELLKQFSVATFMAQIPDVAKRNSNDMKGTMDLMKEAELSAHGVLINSFDEMELTWQKRNSNDMKGTVDLIKEAELSALGVMINSFDKMESKYADLYRKLVKKVWCVEPISLCDKGLSDKIDRGHKASIDEHYCLKWLDSMKLGSVMYACLAASVGYHVTN